MFGVFYRIFTEIDSYGTLMWRSDVALDVLFLILTDQTGNSHLYGSLTQLEMLSLGNWFDFVSSFCLRIPFVCSFIRLLVC